MEKKPQKRHSALRPLSREHHFALLLCWKIRRGLELEIDPIRIGLYVQKMWEHQISEHFEIEEQYLFPVLGEDDKMVQEAISDHRTIRRLITKDAFTIKTLNRIEERLERHVRFEERQLFPLIQENASEEQLMIIENVHGESIPELEYDDPFWVI